MTYKLNPMFLISQLLTAFAGGATNERDHGDSPEKDKLSIPVGVSKLATLKR